jgi:lysophospholipid acyltransferase (LPLAT)-like uncharacterized protein
MLRRLTRHPRFKAAATGLLGRYLAFVFRTTRWRIIGSEHIEAVAAAHNAVIVAFWHENLPVMSKLWVEATRTTRLPAGHVLVSQHRDGRFIGDVVGHFGLRMVYGSTSKGGAASLLSLIRLLRGPGGLVAITPDGPRGPKREAAMGVAQLTALSGIPLLATAGRITPAITLPTWDRMRVPLPFGRGVIVHSAPITVGRDDTEAGLAVIAAALDRVVAEAETAVGLPRT